METALEIVNKLARLGRPENRAGMARFGIAVEQAYGVSVPVLRQYAKALKPNHALALDLWETGVHEARILASLVDHPAEVTEAQLERWVIQFNSWDLCDQCCSNLFNKTPFAYDKAHAWSFREETFVKRAGFVLMAALAIHDKKREDTAFRQFLPLIEQAAADERNFVKKAVNWALRQIGKRNRSLHPSAVATARRILQQPGSSARWIARDALRELLSEATVGRLK